MLYEYLGCIYGECVCDIIMTEGKIWLVMSLMDLILFQVSVEFYFNKLNVYVSVGLNCVLFFFVIYLVYISFLFRLCMVVKGLDFFNRYIETSLNNLITILYSLFHHGTVFIFDLVYYVLPIVLLAASNTMLLKCTIIN